ncbi:MAG: TrkA C-terminal domain-containing protein [Verrucomicrobiota bacterium]
MKPLPPLLRDADLKSVTLGALSAAAGKRIRELQLRTRCGASIVGIERDASSLVNPGAEEELRVGDHVLLLGSTEQIRSAEEFLSGESALPGKP